MAPLKLYSDNEDDFVRTISDTDPVDDELLAEETNGIGNHDRDIKNGKKRKRFNFQDDEANGRADKKAKNTKNGHESSLESLDKRPESLEEGEKTWTAGGEDDGMMDSDFEFQVGNVQNGVSDDFHVWDFSGQSMVPGMRRDKKGVDIDEIIARRKNDGSKNEADTDPISPMEHIREIASESGQGSEDEQGSDVDEDEEDETLADDAFGMGAVDSDDGSSTEERHEVEVSESETEEEGVADPMPQPDDLEDEVSSADERNDPTERAKREAFFAPEDNFSKPKVKSLASGSFQNMSLSRPILRGLSAVGFLEPTPIQTKTVPVALLGKDVVGGAVTGSGKTAAFIIPILERLLYRPKKVPTSRVAILMPTRELAVQCFNVAKKLANFTDITFCQLVGGFSLREQETVLKQRPDVIIATPGRFIDHMRNSASFTVDTLEILVLDEADRMLEDGFADELNEILTTIPKSRQTMLFSATMTDRVDKLIRIGLNRPVRIMVDARKQTVGTLTQEFVRLRPGREDKRLGYLMYLSQNIYTDRVIVFFRQKKEAHRFRIIFGLSGIRATELHGSMSQEQVSSPMKNSLCPKGTIVLTFYREFQPFRLSAPATVPIFLLPTLPLEVSTSATSPQSLITKLHNLTKSISIVLVAPLVPVAQAVPAQ